MVKLTQQRLGFAGGDDWLLSVVIVLIFDDKFNIFFV